MYRRLLDDQLRNDGPSDVVLVQVRGVRHEELRGETFLTADAPLQVDVSGTVNREVHGREPLPDRIELVLGIVVGDDGLEAVIACRIRDDHAAQMPADIVVLAVLISMPEVELCSGDPLPRHGIGHATLDDARLRRRAGLVLENRSVPAYRRAGPVERPCDIGAGAAEGGP